MEKGRSSKIIAIIALCISIVGLSLGFAAFASNLSIKSGVSVEPDAGTFNVDFSTTKGSIVAGNVSGDVSSTVKDFTGAIINPIASVATIDNSKDDSVIKDIKATFATPGQTVTYNFWVHNGGQYDAYLNTVTFANAVGRKNTTSITDEDLGSFKYCTAGTGTNADMVSQACNNIALTVTLGEDTNASTFTSSASNVSHPKLTKGTSEKVTITITYTGTDVADGDFTVYFGDIALGYSSVD